MKKNLFFTKKTKGRLIALLIVVCGLFVNTSSAQALYTWNGSALDGKWETPGNWTTLGPVGTVPGNHAGDTVVISNGDSVIYFDTKTIAKLTLSNATGPSAGSTLTIEADATLTVNNGGLTGPIVINGGNLVNNGNLSVISSSSGTTSLQSFVIGNPAAAVVGGPFTYGYTGGALSTLTINLNATSAGTSAAAFAINATTGFSNSKIRLVFNGYNEYISNRKTIYTFRTIFGATNIPAPLSIGGTYFKTNASLFSLTAGSNTTVESGTVLNSDVAANGTYNIIMASSDIATTTFTNKGTIEILGDSNGFSGIILNSAPSTNFKTLNFVNQGTIDVNMACAAVTRAPFHITNSGTSRGQVNITNTGTMNLKNTTTTVGAGFAFLANTNAATPNIDFINNGTLNLSGTNFVQGGQVQTIITNNGTLNSNQELTNLTLLNNSGKTISFVKDDATLASTSALTTLPLFTNNGKIETAIGTTQLNNLVSVSALSSFSSIEPGGATGKGIASFSGASFPLSGTFKLQVAGNTAAGTDYDQVTNVLTNGGFTINPLAVLDVTGISGAATPVDVIVANGTGTISGTFASVVGLTAGWTVNYATAGRVRLVYSGPPLSVNDSLFNENSVSVYKNNGALYVNSGAVEINNIKVFDVLGKLLVEQKNVKSASASINNLKVTNQVLIVKISDDENKVVTKKVVF